MVFDPVGRSTSVRLDRQYRKSTDRCDADPMEQRPEAADVASVFNDALHRIGIIAFPKCSVGLIIEPIDRPQLSSIG
jgi:hypothetical protein